MHDKKRRFLLHSTCLICLFASPVKAQSLEDTLLLVYETNPSIEAERAKLRAVDEQVSQALGFWRPSIDAQAYTGGIYQNTPNNPIINPATEALNTNSVGVQVTQPIFRGFRTVSGVKAAEKQVEAERATLDNIEQQVFLETATAYFDVLRDEAIVEVNKDFQKALNGKLGETQHRFSAHDVTRTDVDQATARLKRSEAGRMQADASLASHRATFYQLTGEMPGTLKEPTLDLPPIKDLDEAIALTRKQNPAVQAAGSNEDEAREEVNINRGSLLPELNLVGSGQRQWGVSDLIPGRQDTAQVLLQLTVPLYRTGADYSKTRAALQTVTERRMRLEETRRQAEQLIIAAWQNLATLKNVIAADKVEADAAEKALSGVMKEFPAGSRDTLDVLNAEQEVMDAKVGLVQAQHDEAVMVLQIRAAVGALTAKAMKLPIPLYDPAVHYEATRSKLLGFETPDGEPEAKEVDQSDDVKVIRTKASSEDEHSENMAPGLAIPPGIELPEPRSMSLARASSLDVAKTTNGEASPSVPPTEDSVVTSETNATARDAAESQGKESQGKESQGKESQGKQPEADLTVPPIKEWNDPSLVHSHPLESSVAKEEVAPPALAVTAKDARDASEPQSSASVQSDVVTKAVPLDELTKQSPGTAADPNSPSQVENNDDQGGAIAKTQESEQKTSIQEAPTSAVDRAKAIAEAAHSQENISTDSWDTPAEKAKEDAQSNDAVAKNEPTLSSSAAPTAEPSQDQATQQPIPEAASSVPSVTPSIELPPRQKDEAERDLYDSGPSDYPSQDRQQRTITPVTATSSKIVVPE